MSEVDQQLSAFLREQWVSRSRVVLGIGIGFSFLLFAYDYSLYPETLGQTTVVRVAVIVFLASMFLLLRMKRFVDIIDWGAPLITGVFIASSDWVFHIQGVQAEPDRVFAYTASTFVIFYLLPMRELQGAIYLAFTYAAYFGFGAVFGYPPIVTFALPYLIQALVIVAVGIIGNKVFLKTKRSELAAVAALARAQGLAAMSELANGVAHEINNPLGSARSLLDSLGDDLKKAGGEAASEGLETLGHVRAQIDRAKALISELSTLSAEAQQAPKDVDLADLVRVAADAIARQAALSESAVQIERPQAPLHVRASHAQLLRVFECLLENAVDAERKAGRTPAVHVAFEPSGAQVSVVVEDHGVGITPEIREKIFQPFFTTRRGEHRPGLGLYLAHEIVRSLGGQILVESTPQQGSTFRVSLPLTI